MDLYTALTQIIADVSKEKDAREVAETDMELCGIEVRLLKEYKNVRNNNLIKEITNGWKYIYNRVFKRC